MANGYPSAEEVAAKIRYIHESSFAGKSRGRFRIEDELMRELSGRPGRLQDNTFEDIRVACAEEGLKNNQTEALRGLHSSGNQKNDRLEKSAC